MAEKGNHIRQIAQSLLRETLNELSPKRLMKQRLRRDGAQLRIRPREKPDGGELAAARTYRPENYQRRLVLALGKAAAPMWLAWRELAELPGEEWESLLISPSPGIAAEGCPGAAPRQFRGGHPEPNADSRAGAEAMLAAARALEPPAFIVHLISGGGSALAESPLEAGWDMKTMQALYRQLVGCGAPIGEINALRKHLSSFKGGRLAAAAAAGVEQLTILLSDVPAGEADNISSGPTLPDNSTVEDCYRIHAARQLQLPAAMEKLFRERRLPETPKPGAAGFAQSRWVIAGDNHLACETLAQQARAAGYEPVIDHRADEAEHREAAEYLLRRWRALRQEQPRACLIAGGEVRVQVPERTGRGGRNQAFALECAARLRPTDPATIASLGTDGVDGNSPAAGAIVDATTRARAARAGYSLERAAADFDAYRLLAAIGDTIETGPTGNNLRDLRIFIS